MPEISESNPGEAPPAPGAFSARRATSGALALLIMVALVLALIATHSFGAVFGQPLPTTGSTPAPISQAQRVGARAATPSTTPASFSPSMSYQTAWGLHAATADYSVTIDASHVFAPNAVAPDGRTLLGVEQISSTSSSVQAGYFDPVTRHFTAIGVGGGGDQLQCCLSDGRFIVAADNTQPETTGSFLHWRYWSYDLWTGRLRLVATGDTYQGVYSVALVHGLLYLSSGKGMLVANLAAGSTLPLLAGQTTGAGSEVVYSWPYLVYATFSGAIAMSSTLSSFRVYNLATGQNSLLPTLGLFDGEHGSGIAYSIVGDSLIAAETADQAITEANSANTYGETSTTTFYALDHVLSGGTRVTPLGSFTSEGTPGYTVADDTLYVSVLNGQMTGQTPAQLGVVLQTGWTTLYAIDHVTSGGSSPQVLGTFNGVALDIVGANARVIAFIGGVWNTATQQLDDAPVFWDLLLHTFVTFSTVLTFIANNSGFLVDLTGNELAVVQGNIPSEAVLFFDTSKLPSTSAAG